MEIIRNVIITLLIALVGVAIFFYIKAAPLIYIIWRWRHGV